MSNTKKSAEKHKERTARALSANVGDRLVTVLGSTTTASGASSTNVVTKLAPDTASGHVSSMVVVAVASGSADAGSSSLSIATARGRVCITARASSSRSSGSVGCTRGSSVAAGDLVRGDAGRIGDAVAGVAAVGGSGVAMSLVHRSNIVTGAMRRVRAVCKRVLNGGADTCDTKRES